MLSWRYHYILNTVLIKEVLLKSLIIYAFKDKQIHGNFDYSYTEMLYEQLEMLLLSYHLAFKVSLCDWIAWPEMANTGWCYMPTGCRPLPPPHPGWPSRSRASRPIPAPPSRFSPAKADGDQNYQTSSKIRFRHQDLWCKHNRGDLCSIVFCIFTLISAVDFDSGVSFLLN